MKTIESVGCGLYAGAAYPRVNTVYINILAIKSSELESLILFYSNFPCVSSTLFDNRTQSLIDFTTRMIDSNFFGEFDFVECLCFIKLFHSTQFENLEHSIICPKKKF